MNKNLFKTFAIAAMAVLAGACAKEQVASGDGETVEMTFNVDVPETAITTKGLSDAAQVDELVFQVFLRGAKDQNKHYIYTPVPELTQTVPVVDKKATVKVSLVKGQTYSFAFWAQTKGTGFYDTSDLRAVKMNTAKVKANDPEMDAFYGYNDYKPVKVSYSEHITLLRALAQVNFGAKTLDRSDALKAKESSITLSKVPDTFHPFWKTSEGEGSITFANNVVISDEKLVIADKTDNTEYDYLATAYVFANKEKSILIDAAATITLSNGKTTEVAVPNAPIQVNYRTNILGDLLNFDGVWNITIDEEFKGGDWIYDPVGSELKKGSAVTLTEDYSAFKSSGAVIPMNKVSSLDLNGYTFKNEKGTALDVRGSLTINGSGKVLCEGPVREANAAVFVQDGGKVVINDGYYYSKNGNSCIYVQAGKVTGNTITIGGEVKPLYYGGGIVEINGGVFEADANKFVLNQNDYIENESCFSVKGGIFVEFNPAEVNECHGKVTSFVADGYRAVETTYNGKPAWKVVDASVSVADQAEFEKTLSDLSGTDDVIIKLGTGNFEFKKSGYAGNITLKGAGIGKTVVTSNTYYENKGVTISLENLTFDSKNPYVGDVQLCQFLRSDIAFTNCEINGVVGVMAPKSATFTGCTFKNSTNSGFTGYSIIYYGYDNSTVTVDDCTFETTGKAICLYGTAGIYNLVVKDCEFLTSNKDKAAIQIHTDYTNGDAASTLMRGNVNITNTTVSGFNGIWWEGLNNKTPKVPTKYFTITIDGTAVQTAEKNQN